MDNLELLAKYEENLAERQNIDIPLVSWWWTVLFTLLTFGIFGIYIFVKRANRVDGYIKRKFEYYRLLLQFSNRNTGRWDLLFDTQYQIYLLSKQVKKRFKKVSKIRGILSLFLIIITCGLYFFVYAYKMNKIWYELQQIEYDFDVIISNVWVDMHIIENPFSFPLDKSLEKSYFNNIALTVLTLGFWLIYWDYQMHNAPLKFYRNVHATEDGILYIMKRYFETHKQLAEPEEEVEVVLVVEKIKD